MLSLRFFQPLFFALALLFAQQGGALHALRHALAEQVQQQNKQAPHSPYCEECTTYAQLGSALNVGCLSFDLCAELAQSITQHQLFFFNPHTLPAVARGPPYILQSFA